MTFRRKDRQGTSYGYLDQILRNHRCLHYAYSVYSRCVIDSCSATNLRLTYCLAQASDLPSHLSHHSETTVIRVWIIESFRYTNISVFITHPPEVPGSPGKSWIGDSCICQVISGFDYSSRYSQIEVISRSVTPTKHYVQKFVIVGNNTTHRNNGDR